MSAITPRGVVIECSEESPIEIERVNKGLCAPLQIRLQKPIFPERTPLHLPFPPLLICICPETGRREDRMMFIAVFICGRGDSVIIITMARETEMMRKGIMV
ncbi:hypothetical protein CDAR_128461 [Caerostris darwini]|uniref:Uncharacterized protein n=1 Tax=Caerostris darwini TaxID=1538125 RepID=A0AAV4PES6_9ARAC|nr:hypothetical protein CDAR_128461 [Caerostris darwini]